MVHNGRVKRAIYPGSFDPITNGHVNLVERVSSFFDTVIIAVASSDAKKALFTLEERVELTRQAAGHIPNVEVIGFTGLLIDITRELNAKIVVRGLRAVSDFEYEFQLAWMNRQLDREIETLFFAPSAQYAFVSATLVKEIASFGGDVSQFLHPAVHEALKKKLNSES